VIQADAVQLVYFKIIKVEKNHVIFTCQIYRTPTNAKMWVFRLRKRQSSKSWSFFVPSDSTACAQSLDISWLLAVKIFQTLINGFNSSQVVYLHQPQALHHSLFLKKRDNREAKKLSWYMTITGVLKKVLVCIMLQKKLLDHHVDMLKKPLQGNASSSSFKHNRKG
jgi:hypothetical protein